MSTIKGTVSPSDATMQNITGRIGTPDSMAASVNYGSPANPSNNHAMLINRDAKDQHPIESISGLDYVLNQINEKMLGMINDWSMDEEGFLYLHANGEVAVGPIGPFNTGNSGTGPGGSTGSFVYTITVTNLLDSRMITVAEGERVVLRFNYSSVDDESIDDGPGLGQVLVGGAVRTMFTATQGPNEIDVTDYLVSGTNNVTVRIANSENNSKPLAYVITVAAVSLLSSFDASIPYSGEIIFPYTPTGIADKKVHFELDGREIGTANVSTSGRQLNYTIPSQNHGAHTLRVWFTCDIEGINITSNVLYYSIICTVDGNTTPIIAVTTPPASSVEQYSNIVTKYRVYDPSGLMAAITLEANGNAVQNLTVDRTEQTWSYQPMLGYIEYLKMPGTIAGIIVGIILAANLIGELLELKGKVVPEFMKFRKYFKRKKDEKKENADTLKAVILRWSKSTSVHLRASNSASRRPVLRSTMIASPSRYIRFPFE